VKTLITASWKVVLLMGVPGAPDRRPAHQLQEAPRRFSWSMIVPRDFLLCCQTRRPASHLMAVGSCDSAAFASGHHLRGDAGVVAS
jgi:hypothetical protein